MSLTLTVCIFFSDQDPVDYVVPDLKNFITKSAWTKAEQMSQELHHKFPDGKKLPVAEREEIGLDFVDSVVDMFVSE